MIAAIFPELNYMVTLADLFIGLFIVSVVCSAFSLYLFTGIKR